MKMHNLGSTGVRVSEYCLGAMMFGKMGNPDHEASGSCTARSTPA
jgi:aryl-alcohol dehydrogenase-like predicted oxidoreductase